AIEAAEEAAKVRDTLVARVEMLEQSESFRLGYAIVRVGTAPRRLLQNIRRKAATPPATPESTAKAGKKAVRKEPADPVEPEKIVSVLTNDELARAHTAGGVDAIIAAIRDRAGQQPTLRSAALVQVSRQATDAGIEEIEYQLVQKAVELDRSDRTLRAMYWASQRAGNVREAWRYLTEIENLYGLNPNPSQMRWLEKGRSGPIMNLALL